MKKSVGLVLAGVLAATMMTPIAAAETTTTDPTTTASGAVWGQLSGKDLKQMKFTAPIKIDFAVTPATTPATTGNKLTVGNGYTINVAGDSQVAMKLDKITISKTVGSFWALGDTATVKANTTNKKLVNLLLNGTELKVGDNAITSTIPVGDAYALAFTGHGSGADLATTPVEKSEQAFNIVYTVSQVNP